MTTKLIEDAVGTAVATPPELDGTRAGATETAPGTVDATVSAAASGRIEASRFELGREIGKGGMATIFLATDRGASPPRPVAMKVMHPHLESDPSLVRRFEHEVRSQVGLVHPNVVELIGWGRDARGQLFMALEYVDGPALKDLLAQGRRFPVDLACYVAIRMLKGLGEAHARGLVHRDVKPANIMVTLDGQVKVADFGISKSVDMTRLTSTGNVIGTPAYMSPEQALARELDHRSDLFSVGVTLYEMLVGSNPFQTGNPATTLSRVVHHQQRPVFEALPQTPVVLEELVDGLLQKDPGKRIASVEAAVELLERCVRDDDLAATREAMAQFVKEPDATTRRLCQRRGRRAMDMGQKLYAGGKGSSEAAVWQFFLATLLDPGNQEARTWLEQVSRERGYNLERKAHPRIDELEASLASEPDSLPVLLQLAKLHKAQGNFLQVIFYYKRAKALRPPDNYTRSQIETLVPAHAATVIDGTAVFETLQGVPVRVRPAPKPAKAEAAKAEGWGDFFSGILSTGWGKGIVAAGIVAGLIVAAGKAFDGAVDATSASGASVSADTGDPEVDQLAHCQALADGSSWEAAENGLRKWLERFPDSRHASEATFRLGDVLESQGRRDEAIEVHGANAKRPVDQWTLRSREERGELFALDGNVAAARSEHVAVIEAAKGDQRVRSLLALGSLELRDGHDVAAKDAYEEAVRDSGGAMHDRARLDLAAFSESTGDVARAQALFAEVRDSTDHRGDAFREASAGLERLAGSTAAGSSSWPEPAAAAPASSDEPEPITPTDESAPAAMAPEGEATQPAGDAAPPAEDTPHPPTTGLFTGLGSG